MNSTNSQKKVSLVLTEQAVLSLRESDFDTCSAIAEAIDNSIQAKASEIHLIIHETETTGTRGRQPIIKIDEIAFGDNGEGMEIDILHRCMQLGYSTRYNNRNGIGRFGVGMTLAAINQCKRIEVYSKSKETKEWYFTYVDLEEMYTDTNIPEPIQKNPPDKYLHLVGRDQGTLVVWSKCDRAKGDVENIKHWISRTYRKFIGKEIVKDREIKKNEQPIKITVNNEQLEAFDPLYAIRCPGFPEGPCAELFELIEFEMPVPEDANIDIKNSKVTIQMSILPEGWRQIAGRGGKQYGIHIEDNEGFSILRSNREIFYDIMPRFEPKPESADGVDRWWSAEISFEPALDNYFSVRNIKLGARFVKELREVIQQKMAPTIYEVRKQARETFKRNKTNQQVGETDVTTEHAEAEHTVKEVAPVPGKAGKEKTEEEKKREIETILRPIISTEEQLAAWVTKIENQPCTIIDNEGTNWRGNTFLDIHPQGGRIIIEYNRSHEFFIYVYNIINHVIKSNGSNLEEVIEDAKKLKVAIDLLFMAFAQAESHFDINQEQRVEQTLDFLKSNWGMFLKQFVLKIEKDLQI